MFQRTTFFVLLIALFIPLLASCGANQKTAVPEELSFFAMDTYMTLKVYKGEKTAEEAQNALVAARNAILQIESIFSVNNADGEIAALNRGETVEKASEHTVKLLTIAKELYERTDGLYDITVYPLVQAWGFTTEEGPSVPSVEEIESAMREIDFTQISVNDHKDGSYSIVTGGAKLDLGSIAKGYAGQIAAETLKEHGFDSAILVLGGNVQTLGKKPDGSGFNVGIADPESPDRSITTVSTATLDGIFTAETEGIKSYAIITSGTYQRNFTEGDKTYHHIMDVRTGYPSENGLRSVTVICPDGALADGLSTSLFLLGREGALEYYRTYGGFEAILITDSGEIIKTDGLKNIN